MLSRLSPPPPQIRPQVHLNGELAQTHESYSGSTFNTLGVTGSEVSTVKLESIGLLSSEWISLIEVSGLPSTVSCMYGCVMGWLSGCSQF